MTARAAWLALLALAACSKPAEQPSGQSGQVSAQITTPPATPPSIPLPPSDSPVPERVLIAWAKAVSLRDWASAYRYWGDQGAASGMSQAAFAAKWGKLANPEFEIGPGETEGAAGSLFYTAPVVLIDGARREKGTIVLRRVNNVPGASAEQLRWHIERLSIEP